MFDLSIMKQKGIESFIKTGLAIGLSTPVINYVLGKFGMSTTTTVTDALLYIVNHYAPVLSTMTLGGLITSAYTMFMNWQKHRDKTPVSKAGVRG